MLQVKCIRENEIVWRGDPFVNRAFNVTSVVGGKSSSFPQSVDNSEHDIDNCGD